VPAAEPEEEIPIAAMVVTGTKEQMRKADGTGC